MLRLIITTFILGLTKYENMFANIYILLENNELLYKTFDIIEKVQDTKPAFFIDNDLIIKHDNMVVTLFKEYIEIKVMFKNVRTVTYCRYYEDFTWGLDEYTDDLCASMASFVSKGLRKVTKLKDMYIFIKVFPDHKSLTIDDEVLKKENEFFKKLGNKLSKVDMNNIKIIDNILFQYYKKGLKKCFFYECTYNNGKLYYPIPCDNRLIMDYLDAEEDYNKKYGKSNENMFDNLLPITGSDKSFNRYVIEKISTDKEHTILFFNCILLSTVKFNHCSLGLNYYLLKDLLQHPLILSTLTNSTEFLNFLKNFKLTDFVKENDEFFIESYENLKKTIYNIYLGHKSRKSTLSNFYNQLEDECCVLLKYIFRNYKKVFIQAVQDILNDDNIKIRLHFYLNIFLINFQITLQNKISFYIFLFNKITKSKSPLYFISDYKKIGLRSYSYTDFEKDFEFISKRATQFKMDVNYERNLARTFNSSMIHVLRG